MLTFLNLVTSSSEAYIFLFSLIFSPCDIIAFFSFLSSLLSLFLYFFLGGLRREEGECAFQIEGENLLVYETVIVLFSFVIVGSFPLILSFEEERG
jgi:hypothetical protein